MDNFCHLPLLDIALNPANDNDPLRFLSVCSGIEAASVAFKPLGWEAVGFAEIDPAASALLAYHYPDVTNYGDFTQIDPRRLGRVDILCGGTPCQAFSIAGARRSLNDARGNLTLAFVDLAHELAASNGLRNAIWENVCGVLSMPDNAFGCFLAGLVGAGGPFVPVATQPARGKSNRWWRWAAKEKCHAPRWPRYGMVAGPKGRAAWAVKDAQFYGLAQRRERVLVVADFGNGADPAAVLLIEPGVQRNPPSRSEARENVAGTIAGGARKGGGYSTDDVPLTAHSLLAKANSSHDESKETYVPVVSAKGGNNTSGPIDVSPAINAHGGAKGRLDFESEAFVVRQCANVVGALTSVGGHAVPGNSVQNAMAGQLIAYAPEIARCVATREGSSQDFESTTMVVSATGEITHSLRPEGCDASEDGTGRGTPIIAFTAKDYGGVAAVDIAPTLRAGGHAGSHSNAGVMPAIAFNARQHPTHGSISDPIGAKDRGHGVAVTVALRGRDGGATAELGGSVATALRASSGGGDKPHVLAPTVYSIMPQNSGKDYKARKVEVARPPSAAGPVGGNQGGDYILHSAVRRLTPRECERLQGFQWRCQPDYPGAWQDDAGRWWTPDYTRIPVRWYAKKRITKLRPADMWEPGKNADGVDGWWLMAADGPRYKQLGNSWAVPKFRWLGERIQRLMPKRADNDNKPSAEIIAA